MRFFQAALILNGGLLAGAISSFSADTNAPFSVAITVDAAKPAGELTPIWRFFGADEPNYAYMKDGKKLLVRTRPAWRRSRFIFAAIICSPAATARMR